MIQMMGYGDTIQWDVSQLLLPAHELLSRYPPQCHHADPTYFGSSCSMALDRIAEGNQYGRIRGNRCFKIDYCLNHQTSSVS